MRTGPECQRGGSGRGLALRHSSRLAHPVARHVGGTRLGADAIAVRPGADSVGKLRRHVRDARWTGTILSRGERRQHVVTARSFDAGCRHRGIVGSSRHHQRGRRQRQPADAGAAGVARPQRAGEEHPHSDPRRWRRPRPASGRHQEGRSGPPSRHPRAEATRQCAERARHRVRKDRPAVAPAPEGRLPCAQVPPGRSSLRYRSRRARRLGSVAARAAGRSRTDRDDQETRATAPRRTAGRRPGTSPRPRPGPTTACPRRPRPS